jgi:hypothetical protein
MLNRACCALALSSALTLSAQIANAQAAPKTGAEVLERMHAAYAGKWYHTLTFVQKTTIRRQNGTDTIQIWHESLRHSPQTGTQLRIDFGDIAAGNGVLYTPASATPVRGGKAAPARPDGNPFLPLIEGVYVQPVAQTVKELASTGVDLSRVYANTWEGKRAWVVGASSASDTTSAQFWIDADRNVLVRMILRLGANSPPYDVHVGGYVPLAGGWLGTNVVMYVNGVRQQAEEYSDWKAGVSLDPALFDTSTWMTAKHWGKPR